MAVAMHIYPAVTSEEKAVAISDEPGIEKILEGDSHIGNRPGLAELIVFAQVEVFVAECQDFGRLEPDDGNFFVGIWVKPVDIGLRHLFGPFQQAF